MKSWMKAFIPVLLIILLLFNCLTMVQREYINKYLLQDVGFAREIERKANNEAYSISQYMYHHFENNNGVNAWRAADPDTIRPLMEAYVSDHPYSETGVYFRLYKAKMNYSTATDMDPFDQYYRNDLLQKYPVTLSSLENGDVQFVRNLFDGSLACVMRSLPDCEDYKLVCIQPVELPAWNRILNIVQICGLIASIIMAAFMLLSMRSLTKPVSELTRATREYAKGNRSQRLDPIGWDEVAELARLFNSMADETRRLELVEEDADRKQRFLDSFTHELRTPLTNIHGYSELMKRVQLSEEDRLRYLDYMMHESRRLNRLSEALFNLTVLRENTTQMEPVSCAALLDNARQSLQEKAEEKGVSLVCEESDCTVRGNDALLESLVTNLAENAIRACAAGDEVRLRFQNDGADVVLKVTDTGMGIAAEQLAHITEPFYRVDKARSRAEGGVGLGLYLCSEIVRVHGADMSFDSIEGEGTTVTVRFPGEKNN